MNRLEVVQYLLNEIGGKTYLEIGVESGESFCPIIAQRKIAVDPTPASPRVRAHLLQHLGATYYQTTSDDFFAQKGRNFEDQKIDVALIDGLHTYAQSLRDVENCLRHLSADGVIVVHDCNPLTESAAASWSSLGSPKFVDLIWNGDVWKTIAHLRSYRDDVNVFVLDCDYGLGIVTKGEPENMLKLTAAEIESMTFYDLDNNRELILNLKGPEYLYTFMERRAVSGPAV
jgi:hypothetical protein